MTSVLLKSRVNKIKWVYLLAWAIFILTRFTFPLADPPTDLSWSGGYMADEGFWVHDARNLTLFNEYGSDQWHNRFVSPLVHYPVLFLFQALGASLLSVRIWAGFLGILSFFLLHKITSIIDPQGKLLLLFSLLSPLVAFQRLAILETAVLPMALLTFYLWLIARKQSVLETKGTFIEIVIGMLTVCTWLVKSNQVYFLAVVPLATLLTIPDYKKALKAFALQIAGQLMIFGIWFFCIGYPHSKSLSQFNSYYLSQQGQNIQDFLKNILIQPFGLYFSSMPFIFPLGMAVLVILGVKRNFKLQPPAIVFSLVWLAINLIFLSPMGYRPFRYYLPALIPLVVLAFRFLTHDLLLPDKPWQRLMIILVMWGTVAINIPVILDSFFFRGSYPMIPHLPGFNAINSLITVFVSFSITLAIAFKRFSKTKISKQVLTAIFMLIMCFHSLTIAHRIINRTYSVLETSRELTAILPSDAVIGGQWAPQLALETQFKAVPVWRGFVNGEDPFSRYGVTHLIAWEYALGNELSHQIEWFPEYMKNAVRITTFKIKNSDVSLWEIHSSQAKFSQ